MNLVTKRFSENFKNVGKLSLGTILGQLISIISLPIFTRIYGPTVMGNMALFTSVAVIINSFSDLGMSNAIMVEEEEEEAGKVYKIVSTISLGMSLLFGMIFFFFSNVFFESVDQNPLFVAIVLAALIFSSQQIKICYTWLNRRKQYKLLMLNPIINNGVVLLIGLVIGLSGYVSFGYYICIILGQVVTLIHMKRFLPKGFFSFAKQDYVQICKKHYKFVSYQMPSNIVLQVKGQLPTLLINLFFGPKVLGYYYISMRVLGMPITFLASSLGKVFFQTASEIKRKGGEIGEYTLKLLSKAMKISFIPIILMLCIGDIVILLLFGSEYIIGANILRIMTFYGFFLFLSMSVDGIATVIDRQKYLLVSGLIQLIGITIGIWIGAKIFNSVYISVSLFSLTFCIIQVVYFCFIFKTTKINISRYLKPLFIEIVLILLVFSVLRSFLLLLGIVETI
ncbi:oligosaccharide flippase family protein [Paenibacillus typhae]|uniref:Membrane protein involved in the export of O-antigen and teichoic acid n=1 Tax=Paenibacillus typhae TaxID=1174501 RepID=A0A1G8RP68_9BACL|nr:oligosaccharide flippase family protein [Paenibacillus typhae]SDJ18729.1 Membrane protein involved in the export of O-antigen and teichoic acid [Paenibacillus typhae]